MPPAHAESAVTDLLAAGRHDERDPLTRRDVAAQSAVGITFLAAAIACGVFLDADRVWPADHALLLTILFAIALRVRFEVGAGFTVPVQLAFIPMLLLLPTPWVPMLVLAGFLLDRLPDLARHHLHPTRLILLPGNAWFAIGPAVILSVFDAQTPQWSAWPIYLLALAAQFIIDITVSHLREWLGRGITPGLQLQVVGVVPLIDALLSPLGLLAAFASQEFAFAYLLLVPPAGLLLVYARERSARVRAAAELVETEREAILAREELVAGASHEILTPLAVVSGLANRLASDVELDPGRRRQAVLTLRRETAHLRHLARQFVDYTRLRSGQPLTTRPRTTCVAAAIEEVAETFGTRAPIHVELNGDRPSAHVDPDRLQQMLMVLISNAVKHAPGSDVRMSTRAVGGAIEITVSDNGPGIPESERESVFEEFGRGHDTGVEGAGIGLYLCRELARASGGSLRLEAPEGGGAAFKITLPAAG